jgi:small-conductance mechanosensitive channel
VAKPLFTGNGRAYGAGSLNSSPTTRTAGAGSASRNVRAEKVWAVIGGLIVGYIGWLVAISIGADFATVSLWSLVVMVLSLLLGLGAVLRGQRLRQQGHGTLAAFVFALPIPAVLMTLAVLGYTYL